MERKRRAFRRTVLGVALVVLVVGVFVIINLSTFKIRGVTVRGANNVPSGDVELLANSAITGSYVYVVPRSSIFFYPRSLLTTRVKALSPRIASVRVYVNAARTLVIDISERSPAYLWCSEKDACLLVDKGGFGFAQAFGSANLLFPRFIIGSTTPKVGNVPLSLDVFIPLARFIDTVPVKVTRVYVLGERSEIVTKEGYTLIVNIYTDLASARRNLMLALSDPELTSSFARGIYPEYIDLRVAEKVFYKF